MSIFSERLKELRKKRGYTQSELADILNIKRATIAKWETGMTEPRIESLIKLADFFGVSLDWLFGRE